MRPTLKESPCRAFSPPQEKAPADWRIAIFLVLLCAPMVLVSGCAGKKCANCAGSGYATNGTTACADCKGAGTVPTGKTVETPCGLGGGTGMEKKQVACSKCNGTGNRVAGPSFVLDLVDLDDDRPRLNLHRKLAAFLAHSG